jgi:hypothetical protein
MADKVQLLQEICATTVTEEEVDDLILDGFCLSCLNEMEATKCCCGRDLGYWPFFLKIQLCAVILNSYQIADFLIGMAAELITVQFGSRVTNYSWNGCYPWNKECTALNPDISIDPVSFFSGFVAAYVAGKAVDKYMEKYNKEDKIATWIVAGDKRTWCGSIKTLIWYIVRFNIFLDPNTTAIKHVLTFHSLIQSSSISSSSLSSNSLSSSSLLLVLYHHLHLSPLVYLNQYGPHSTYGLLRQFTILFWLLITTCVDQILTPYWSMNAQGVSCDIAYEPVPTCPDNPRQGNGIINLDTPESHPYPVMHYLEKNKYQEKNEKVKEIKVQQLNANIFNPQKTCHAGPPGCSQGTTYDCPYCQDGCCGCSCACQNCPVSTCPGCAAGCTLPAFGPHVVVTPFQSGCKASGAIASGNRCDVQCDKGYVASGTTSYQCTNGQLTDATLTCSAPAPSPDDNCFPKNGIGVNINTLDLYPAGNVSVLCTSSSDPTKYSIALRCNDFDHDFSINGVDYKNMHSRCSLKNGMRQLPKAFPTNKLCQNICYENFCTEADSTYNDATSSWVLPTNCIAPPSKFFNKCSKYN